MSGRSGILILSDGGLAAAVAVAHAAERSEAGARVLVCPIADAGDRGRARAIERAATLAGATLTERLSAAGDVPRLLLDALDLAASADAACVVWPASAGEQGEPTEAAAGRAADIAETAMLAERLRSIHGRGLVRLEAPFADLSDASVCELAMDAGLGPEACWWWGDDDETARVEAERWLRAFAAAGMPADRLAEPKPAAPIEARTGARPGGRAGGRGSIRGGVGRG